jgi:hypothetical protein
VGATKRSTDRQDYARFQGTFISKRCAVVGLVRAYSGRRRHIDRAIAIDRVIDEAINDCFRAQSSGSSGKGGLTNTGGKLGSLTLY